MTEAMIEARMAQINEEYAILPQLENWDLSLETIGEGGDVMATLRRGEVTFEKTFGYTDDLKTISATFNYSEYITPLSCDISLNGLKMAYFDNLGHLITERKDTTEVFKVKPAQRERIEEILKEKLGKLFHV